MKTPFVFIVSIETKGPLDAKAAAQFRSLLSDTFTSELRQLFPADFIARTHLSLDACPDIAAVSAILSHAREIEDPPKVGN